MKTGKYIYWVVFLVTLIAIIVHFEFAQSSSVAKGGSTQSSDILQIGEHYFTLTNCSISVTQRNSRVGTLEGRIIIKPNADISVEWQEHQNDIGDFSHKIYKDGAAAIWERIYKNGQSVKTAWPSLISALDSAQANSHGVSYLIPGMLLGKKTLGDPSSWKPVFNKESDQHNCV